MIKQRRTRQLMTTWQVLAEAADHPSAEEVLRRVRRKLPKVSLGTVYRNLEKLRGLGQARVLRIAGGVARYDATVDEHDHFVCESCGKVIDMEQPARCVDVADLERKGFLVRSQSTTVYGTCRDCGSSNHRSADEAG